MIKAKEDFLREACVDNLWKTWDILLKKTRDNLGNDRTYETWIKPLKPVRLEQNTLVIEIPSPIFYKGLSPFVDTLRFSLHQTLGYTPSLEWVFPETSSSLPVERSKEKRSFSEPQKSIGFVSDNFNPSYLFEDFVVGSCNRLAHAAGQAVARSPGTAYNPLFLYGGVGLGKTHLMQAIGQHAKRTQNCQVSYFPCEVFVNLFIQSIQNKTIQQFRNRFRNIDILLIDDIHFIAGKEGTQEEFFHTFNSLYDQRKQIVLSSDRPPKEINALEKRLVSRFEWGLVADLQQPDFETRVAILRKKCEKRTLSLEDDVIFYIAENMTDNIRLLEGALNRLVAISSLLNKSLSLEIAKEYLTELLASKKRVITIEKIQEKVALYFQISLADLKSKRRLRTLVVPRQIAMFLARTLTENSLIAIADAFGGKDHTTVLHAWKKIKNTIEQDSSFKTMVEKISHTLQE
jgi:chromosomal replication initiator protein